MSKDKSLTHRKEHALTKSQHTGNLIEKHLSRLNSGNRPETDPGEETDPDWERSYGVYEGEIKDGRRHGWGTFRYYDGRTFIGEWKENSANGQGTLIYENGQTCEGHWKDFCLTAPASVGYDEAIPERYRIPNSLAGTLALETYNHETLTLRAMRRVDIEEGLAYAGPVGYWDPLYDTALELLPKDRRVSSHNIKRLFDIDCWRARYLADALIEVSSSFLVKTETYFLQKLIRRMCERIKSEYFEKNKIEDWQRLWEPIHVPEMTCWVCALEMYEGWTHEVGVIDVFSTLLHHLESDCHLHNVLRKGEPIT